MRWRQADTANSALTLAVSPDDAYADQRGGTAYRIGDPAGGYTVSQRIRKRVEEAFGWIKTVAGQRKTRFRGRDRVGWAFTFAAAAYNLVRLPKLLAMPR